MPYEPPDVIVMILTVTVAMSLAAAILVPIVLNNPITDQSHKNLQIGFMAIVAIKSLYIGAKLTTKPPN